MKPNPSNILALICTLVFVLIFVGFIAKLNNLNSSTNLAQVFSRPSYLLPSWSASPERFKCLGAALACRRHASEVLNYCFSQCVQSPSGQGLECLSECFDQYDFRMEQCLYRLNRCLSRTFEVPTPPPVEPPTDVEPPTCVPNQPTEIC